MARTDKFNRPLNVLFDEETKTMLQGLTENGRLTQAHVLRELVHHQYKMKVLKTPHCATGGPCLCPHMHAVQRSA